MDWLLKWYVIIPLMILAALVQWAIYGDPRCIVAECRITKS